jgi:hypothetical protein
MTRFERGCRLKSLSAPAYRPLDPTAVCFLFDTANPQNPNLETRFHWPQRADSASAARIPRQNSRIMPEYDKKRAACCLSRRAVTAQVRLVPENRTISTLAVGVSRRMFHDFARFQDAA